MQRIKFILLIPIIIIINFTSCLQDDCSSPGRCHAFYNFEIGYSTSPNIKSIEIGDTFRINMELPHEIVDIETEAVYDFSNFYYSLNLSLINLDVGNKLYTSSKPGVFDFSSIPFSGSIDPVSVGDLFTKVFMYFDSLENKRICSFDVIANESGIFASLLNTDKRDLEEYTNEIINFTDTCCIENMYLHHNYLSSPNNNFDLINDLTGWASKTNPNNTIDLDGEELARQGLFIFEVK